MTKKKEEIVVTEQMRVDQLKIIDLYEEAAKSTSYMQQFLVLLGKRVNQALTNLDKVESSE
jgi:hypothetical protein